MKPFVNFLFVRLSSKGHRPSAKYEKPGLNTTLDALYLGTGGGCLFTYSCSASRFQKNVISEQLLCKFGNILVQISSRSKLVLVSEVLKEMDVGNFQGAYA